MIVDVVTFFSFFLHVSPVSVASHVSPYSADRGRHSLQCMVYDVCSVS